MNDESLWTDLRGHDSDGVTLLNDLKRLVAGQLDEETSSELLSDFVRENAPTSAGYAALPYLINGNQAVSVKTRLEMLHAACLIMGLAYEPASPEVPASLAGYFDPETKRTALQKLLRAASEVELNKHDIICIASVALLLNGDRESFWSLSSQL